MASVHAQDTMFGTMKNHSSKHKHTPCFAKYFADKLSQSVVYNWQLK